MQIVNRVFHVHFVGQQLVVSPGKLQEPMAGVVQQNVAVPRIRGHRKQLVDSEIRLRNVKIIQHCISSKFSSPDPSATERAIAPLTSAFPAELSPHPDLVPYTSASCPS